MPTDAHHSDPGAGAGYSPNDALSYRSATTHQWVTFTRNERGEWWANDERETPASDADIESARQDDSAVFASAAARHPYPGGRCPHGSVTICPHCEPRRFKRAYVQAQALLAHGLTLSEVEAEDIVDQAQSS